MGCTVEELLGRISSRELAEWQAFERVSGPIDGQWRDEVAAQHLELMHLLAWMFGQSNFKGSPVSKPENKYPRPYEVFKQER